MPLRRIACAAPPPPPTSPGVGKRGGWGFLKTRLGRLRLRGQRRTCALKQQPFATLCIIKALLILVDGDSLTTKAQRDL